MLCHRIVKSKYWLKTRLIMKHTWRLLLINIQQWSDLDITHILFTWKPRRRDQCHGGTSLTAKSSLCRFAFSDWMLTDLIGMSCWISCGSIIRCTDKADWSKNGSTYLFYIQSYIHLLHDVEKPTDPTIYNLSIQRLCNNWFISGYCRFYNHLTAVF